MKIKEIESGDPINCPFCNELIRDDDEQSPCFDKSGRCEHLLFVAVDEGFEFRSNQFNQHMNIEPPRENETDDFFPENEEDGIDGFTNKVTIPGYIKLAIYEPHGFNGAYFGFAPNLKNA